MSRGSGGTGGSGGGSGQPADSDLTTIAAIDATGTGILATDGSGWVLKAYSALKTALSLTASDVNLGNVNNTSDVNKPVSSAQQAAINAAGKSGVTRTLARALFR